MNYKIIEVHQVYQENKISEIAVLWQSNEDGSVRATHCTTDRCGGYKFLFPDEQITPNLIQEVAGQGMDLPDEKKKVYFPGKRQWER